MIVKVEEEEECPYCHKSTEIAHIRTPELVVCQCDSCQKVWMIFKDKRERMIRFKEEGPDTLDENFLCPICWRILEPNYESWYMECKDPTCGYSKRLFGLSLPQRKIKHRYLELKKLVFDYAYKDEVPPQEVTLEYSELRTKYEEVKKLDIFND